MLGNLIARIRKEKGITKTHLANSTGINVGHLTHIEKNTRRPSHSALKNIATALGVPAQPLFYTYDKEIDEKQKNSNYINNIYYNKIPAVSNIDFYIDCPANYSNASFAYKMPDNSMEPSILEGSYAFVEVNGLVRNREIGLFKLNDKFIIRKLLYKKDKFVLTANNSNFNDIKISNSDDFKIIGKIYI